MVISISSALGRTSVCLLDHNLYSNLKHWVQFINHWLEANYNWSFVWKLRITNNHLGWHFRTRTFLSRTSFYV